MNNKLKNNRLFKIRSRIEYGDISRIARILGVHRNWVDKVLKGDGTSERVLEGIEEYLDNKIRIRK